ncbi:MAG: MarR family transcriptional regulator [Lactobacillus sp.]|nr:MarR family transcriptional regulator [Lactobacillus sp.]
MTTENTITALIYTIAKQQNQWLTTSLKTLDLNPDQAKVLDFIAQHPHTNQQSLAKALGRSAASTSNLIKVLAKRDLLTRQFSKHNEREKQLQLTPQGEVLVTQIKQQFQTLDNLATQALAPNVQQDLLIQLTQIKQELA